MTSFAGGVGRSFLGSSSCGVQGLVNIVACRRCIQRYGLPDDGRAPGCPGPYMCAICGNACGIGPWSNGAMPAIKSRTYPKFLRLARENMRDDPPRIERGEGFK